MKSNAAKSTKPTARKSASSSSRSRNAALISESDLSSHDDSVTDELDGVIDSVEVSAVESEAGDRVLAETGINSGVSGIAVLESELMKSETGFVSEVEKLAAKPAISQSPSAVFNETMQAITLHQPWASLIANGSKQYETRNWSTNYRGPIAIHAGKKQDSSNSRLLELAGASNISELPAGAVVAIAELIDCIQMTSEFITSQSETERACGDWTAGRYAWKLENVRAIEPVAIAGKQSLWVYVYAKSETGFASSEEKPALPIDAFGNIKSDCCDDADCGEVLHLAEANGQLNLLKWDSNEPPEPDDFPDDLEAFKAAYLSWSSCLEGTTEEEYQHITAEEIWNQSATGIGLICAAESVPVSLSQESDVGVDRPTYLLNGTSGVQTACSENDFPTPEDLAILKPWILGEKISTNPSISLQPALPANHFQTMENVSEPTTIETASPPSSKLSQQYDQSLLSLKMSADFYLAHTDQVWGEEPISGTLCGSYTKSGTMQNGKLSAALILEHPGVGKDSLLLRSPGALSTTKGRPPGQNRLEVQLQQLWLIQEGEVAAPEFLELGYTLPTGWTNPEENRTAIELSQVQTQQLPTVPNLELPLVMESTAIDAQPLETLSTGELQPLDSNELNILPALQNLGSFNKDELLSIAREQHQLICGIERKEFGLAIEKLHRVRATGICLQEFKRRCKYGEFENELEQAGISIRSSQQYMVIAKNWDIVEAKTKLVSLLTEESRDSLPAIGLKWALEAVRDEKKQLKSAAPPADPDCWRTPNTIDQPIIHLVTTALGGEIWCDPCADAGHHIPARVHYNSSDSGLAARNLWRKTVFINPPFSNPLEWVDKCCDSIIRGDCSQAIMLLKAGTLSNQGTGELIKKFASGICHWRGRINFLNDNGIAVKGSDFDCVLIYFGDRFDRFQETFETFGTVSFIENHYSSVNKRPVPAVKSIAEESRELAAAVGLSNGKSVLPDLRDSDRELMERCDPNTCDDRPLTSNPTTTVEMTRSESLAMDRFELAKQNCLKDYIVAVSSSLSDFSDEQIAFLAKAINEESAKRICGF